MSEPMDLRVNDVDRSLIAKAKAAATNSGMSLRQWVINLLTAALREGLSDLVRELESVATPSQRDRQSGNRKLPTSKHVR